MQIIHVNIANRIATAEEGTWAVLDNSDYRIQFTFDAEWASYLNKNAVFVWQEGEGTVAAFVSFTGNVVAMPKISGSSYVLVGVTAGDSLTSTAAKIPCRASIITHAGRAE